MKNSKIKGYIFLCSNQTEQECFDLLLCGGKEKYKTQVKGLEVGSTIFLYNYQKKLLYGRFSALTPLRKNIIKNAWKGEYPWQIKVRRATTYAPLHREDITKGILKFNSKGLPGARLTQEKINALTILFKSPARAKTYDDSRPHATLDGHQVRSLAESKIDDWLYEHRIAHGYETPVGSKNCDFEVPRKDGSSIFIEYWGLRTKEYLKNKQEKIELYKKKGLRLIEIEPNDKISDKLKTLLDQTY